MPVACGLWRCGCANCCCGFAVPRWPGRECPLGMTSYLQTSGRPHVCSIVRSARSSSSGLATAACPSTHAQRWTWQLLHFSGRHRLQAARYATFCFPHQTVPNIEVPPAVDICPLSHVRRCRAAQTPSSSSVARSRRHGLRAVQDVSTQAWALVANTMALRAQAFGGH